MKVEELLDFFELISGKLSTPRKRNVARLILEEFEDRGGKITAWEFGSKGGVVHQIADELGVSTVYVYKVLGELIDLGIVAKTRRGYELSPVFRKRVYRLYKALGG